MSLAYRELRSGLVLAEQGQDEAAITRALKQLDGRLVLQKERGNVEGGWVYKVICVVSDEHAPIILTWADSYGNPLPLSSGLIEEVKRLRPEARSRRGPDADARNEALKQKFAKQGADDTSEIIADHRGKVERGRITVSLGANTSKRYWQRNKRRPASGVAQ